MVRLLVVLSHLVFVSSRKWGDKDSENVGFFTQSWTPAVFDWWVQN